MAGLSSTGFDRKRLTEIITDLRSATKAEFGNSANVNEDSVFGQIIIGIYADRLDELWSGLEGVYNSFSIDTAEGVQLDNLTTLVGITRNRATRSSVVATVEGNPGTVITGGGNFIAETLSSSLRFQSISGITMSGATGVVAAKVSVASVLASTAYTVTLGGTNYTYTSDVSPTTSEILLGLEALIDASTDWTSSVSGSQLIISKVDQTQDATLTVTANLTVDKVSCLLQLESVDLGPVVAVEGDLTEIVTNIAGLDSITNQEAALLGSNDETDTELRVRTISSLQVGGNGTVDTIRARILDIPGVTGVSVVENDTDTIDGDGRPPHSFEVSVASNGLPETIAAIGQAIWDSKPVGIATYGTESTTAVDTLGATHTVYYSVPVEKLVYARVVYITYDEEAFPIDGEAQIKDAFVEYGEEVAVLDKDIIPQRFFGRIFSNVEGIESLTVYIAVVNDGDPAPTFPGDYSTSKVALASNEIAVYDTTRVTVVEGP